MLSGLSSKEKIPFSIIDIPGLVSAASPNSNNASLPLSQSVHYMRWANKQFSFNWDGDFHDYTYFWTIYMKGNTQLSFI